MRGLGTRRHLPNLAGWLSGIPPYMCTWRRRDSMLKRFGSFGKLHQTFDVVDSIAESSNTFNDRNSTEGQRKQDVVIIGGIEMSTWGHTMGSANLG
jgi:hypothetical protein